jgi:hypothetical protein
MFYSRERKNPRHREALLAAAVFQPLRSNAPNDSLHRCNPKVLWVKAPSRASK